MVTCHISHSLSPLIHPPSTRRHRHGSSPPVLPSPATHPQKEGRESVVTHFKRAATTQATCYHTVVADKKSARFPPSSVGVSLRGGGMEGELMSMFSASSEVLWTPQHAVG